MRVLVTGGQGFIGRYTCEALDAAGHSVLILDRHRAAGACRWPVILGDIRDETAVTEAIAQADGVIHLAGVLGTQETILNPGPAVEINVLGGLHVLQACAQYEVPLVNITVGNWFENNTYSITNAAVERLVAMNAKYRDLPQVSVRAFHAYGPHQGVCRPHGPSKVRKVVPSFTARALAGQPIQVYGDGRQFMDMIWAGDVASVLVAALGQRTATVFEAGCGKPVTVLEMAELIQREVASQAGVSVGIEHLPMRPGETPGAELCAETGTLAPLGIDPGKFLPLEEGIRRTVAWYRQELAP